MTSTDLRQKAYSIKRRFLKMYYDAKAGHIGSSLSCTEILTFIKFACMHKNDHLILSKGHAAAVLYSTLAESGSLSEKDIATFYKNGTYLSAHPPANKLEGIPFATGSLGHGLSISAGLGLAARFKRSGNKIFCITSDGELNEGSTWEAAMFISHHKLSNVVWFIDRNKLQGFGYTEDVMQLEPLHEKLSAFGFQVIKCDGHDLDFFVENKKKITDSEKPVAVICHTVKGKGWETYEGKLDSHYLPFKGDEYENTVNYIESRNK